MCYSTYDKNTENTGNRMATMRLYVKDEAVWREFSAACKARGLSMSELFAAVMREKLAEWGKSQKPISPQEVQELLSHVSQSNPVSLGDLASSNPVSLVQPTNISPEAAEKGSKAKAEALYRAPQKPVKEKTAAEAVLPASLAGQVAEVLAALNTAAARRLQRPGLIPARLREGRSVDECLTVIAWVHQHKDANWQRQYFDHTTPFRPDNFDKYLAAARRDQNHPGALDASNSRDTVIQRLLTQFHIPEGMAL